MTHLPLDALLTGYRDLPAPPKDCGIVRLLVLREPGERRLLPASVRLRPATGAVGDRWSLDREPEADAEVTVMRADVAALDRYSNNSQISGERLPTPLSLSEHRLQIDNNSQISGERLPTPLSLSEHRLQIDNNSQI